VPIRYGDIVEGTVPDPAGRNRKARPLLISFDDEIAAGEPLLVLGITTVVPDPLPRGAFLDPLRESAA
jgi:hypothetical protein